MDANNETDKTPKVEHVSIFVSLWNSIHKIIEKAGFFKTIAVCFMVVFFSLCGYIVTHPNIIFDQFMFYQEKIHQEKVAKRIESNPIVEGLLLKLLVETQAHRCFLIEFHNGKENLTGLSFLYGRMTAQVTADSIKSSINEFDEFNLDQFSLVPEIIHSGYWGGSVDDLMRVDAPLAHKLLINGTHSIVMVTLYGPNSAIGVLGVSFVSETGYNEERVESTVRRYSYQVSNAINKDKL